MMNMTRWLTLVALVLLSSSWALADTAHYEINLEGWDSPQEFTFIPNVTPPTDLNPCLPVGSVCGDASVRINSGGGSTPENGTFTFNSDQVDANGNIFFENTGPTITSAEITTVLNVDELNDPFQCSGGDIFQSCGFVLSDPPSDVTLEVFFFNPFGEGIPSAVPEPSQWILLSLAFAGIVVVRSRRKASAVR